MKHEMCWMRINETLISKVWASYYATIKTSVMSKWASKWPPRVMSTFTEVKKKGWRFQMFWTESTTNYKWNNQHYDVHTHIIVRYIWMVFFQSVVQDGNYDTFSRHSLCPSVLYVHVQSFASILKNKKKQMILF